MPHKCYVLIKAIGKTIYRITISKKHLLEWTTSEEAEKQAKSDIVSYYNQMAFNFLFGIIAISVGLLKQNIFAGLLGILWIVTPMIMWNISKEVKKENPIQKLSKQDQEYLLEIGRKTWQFFKEFLTKENNYLIPDNYQEDRKLKTIPRTSSTNIGLSMLAVISAYDLKYINLDETMELLKNIIMTIESLQKWNGHLYNWYQIKTKEPLFPRYISTVDSGNFVGYLYVVKQFLENLQVQDELILDIVTKIIDETDFSVLFDKKQQIFSIGFNIEENKLTDSYYDLLASEARQASLVAIAKKDVPSKHWKYLSRTLTSLGRYKGLISWSGTAFEYLMPSINIPRYEGSLLDESCKFMLMSQIEYAKELNIPWGISESAFNLKDLKSNYQYKAFGIPWLGLKRGLADDLVVSAYAGILAINDKTKEEIENLKRLEKEGMYGKYGFYESIDYTPERLDKLKKSSVVKTYMAHHQGLILLSINNFFNNNILQTRFMQNPQIEAVSILLQETMPEMSIITKETKEKVEKLKYKDYENYTQTTYKKIDERITYSNVIANEDYTIIMNQKGQGVSKYKDIYINRFKVTDDYPQGIFFAIKNIKTKQIWSSNYAHNNEKDTNYQISFMPDQDKQEIINGNIKTKIKTIVSSNDTVELRRVVLENQGQEEEILEVSSYFEPVLSKKEQDYAHKAFNNLFLIIDYQEDTKSLTIERKSRDEEENLVYANVGLYTQNETIGELEYEINGEKFIGRGNYEIPNMIKNSIPLSKKTGLVVEPIISLKRTVKVKPGEETIVDFILSVGENKEKERQNIIKYQSNENVKKEFELSKARVEAESRYLGVKGKEIEIYQKMLSYIIFGNPNKSKDIKQQIYKQEDLWKYGISGDLPIIMVKIKDVNDGYVVKEILKAYEFFRTRGIETEIVILDEEKHSYENYVREEIENSILNQQMSYLKNIKGGIFVLTKGETDKRDIELLEFIAKIIIDSSKGSIQNNIKELEEEYFEKYKEIEKDENTVLINTEEGEDIDITSNQSLKYYNEYGGFSEDGKEYKIKVNKENRLPTVWSHIITNEKFGSVITENMGGYSWYKNSRINRVSNWENSPSYDIPSEIIYLKDQETKKCWSLGLNPMPDDRNYNIIYGFGFAKYIHQSDGIDQEYTVFVPKEDSCKIGILNLKNTTPNRKKIKLYYYVKPVIGEDEIKSNGYILADLDKNHNVVIAKNLYKRELENPSIFLSCSENINSYTTDKNFFLGKGGVSNPQALKMVKLNNESRLGKNTCISYEVEIELESFAQKEIAIVLGAEENIVECKNLAYKYSKIQNCKQELDIVKAYWSKLLGNMQVETPLESTNIILNGWAIYQTINSRLIGKSGYYQSGGAFGFRDQLQDTFGTKFLDPNILKNQIIKHSKHQFIEGDVEHWWHEETQRGIRTRFSDDLLWLVFATIEYINFTGDMAILDITTPYLKGMQLEQNQDEKYDKYVESNVEGSIYEHCIKAIEKSFNFGDNGLPKIGSGDWNDALNKVGNKGKGESVWLGFFLYYILENFIPIIRSKKQEDLAKRYENISINLKKALNTKAWDGRWFKRAFMDDGNTIRKYGK